MDGSEREILTTTETPPHKITCESTSRINVFKLVFTSDVVELNVG